MQPLSPLGWFILVALAVWRVTHVLTAEDGPGRVLARLRAAVHGRFGAAVLSCFYCLSLWVAAPFTFFLSVDDWGRRFVAWLALSGAACLLERLGSQAVPPAVFYEGDKEESHELLRRSAPRDYASGGS
jgi:hypothetical protein